MNPGLIFFLAVFLPLFFFLVLFGPVYAGLCIALYLYYGEEIIGYLHDPSYVLSVYEGLYKQWETVENLGFMDFELPVFGPLIGGVLLALILFWFLINYIRNIFVLTG